MLEFKASNADEYSTFAIKLKFVFDVVEKGENPVFQKGGILRVI